MARLAIVALIMVTSIAFAAPSGGLAQQTVIPAAIHQGNCEEIGDVVAPLVDVSLPAGEPLGNEAATPAISAFTTVPMSLDAMVGGDHALVVRWPAGDQNLACGEIGGTLTEAGSLIVGLRAQGDSGVSGIAFLNPAADPTQTNISLFLTGDSLGSILATTFLPPTTVAEGDAARFAEILAARNGAPSVAGPFAGQLVQLWGQRVGREAGIIAEDFSATASFMNPTRDAATSWDVGFTFRGEQNTAQVLAVGSDGSWYYQDSLNGTLQVAPQSAFNATPGATNTLDLVVEGDSALFGVNGVVLARINLPSPVASDVFVSSGLFAEHHVDGREFTYSGFEVWGLPGTTAQAATPQTAAAPDDAARFAAALAARGGTPSLGGPFGGTLHQAPGMLAATGVGAAIADFSATVTFVNPREQTETPWDFGIGFHQILEPYGIQEVYLDSTGLWSYTDFPNGVQQSGIAPTFDSAPGGTNTLDLIVEGDTALFGVNGEFLASLDLPPATASDVLVATDFSAQNIVEGREIIYSTFQVWEAPGAAAAQTAPAQDDAARFAVAIAARDGATSLAGPFTGAMPDAPEGFALRGAKVTAADFSATVTFANPRQQTGTTWDEGFAFHRSGDEFQSIYIDSEGFWYYQGTRSGYATTFNPAPGATNSLDLIVDGNTALVGVNGEFAGRIDLPSPTASDVYVGTSFFAGHDVEGRDIGYIGFEVWD